MYKNTMWIGMLVIGLLASPALASDTEHRADRARYDRLVNELEQAEAAFAEAVADGVEEARHNDGEASLSTQNRIISERNKRDRLMNRVTLLALRHGWEIPEPASPQEPGSEDEGDAVDEIFAPARHVIRDRFADESQQLAKQLVLPVVSLPE